MHILTKCVCFVLICGAVVCVYLSLPDLGPREQAADPVAKAATPAPAEGVSSPRTLAAAAPAPSLPDKVDFNFHIKPILSDRCFVCHGPDKAQVQADLQLHDPALAFNNLAQDGEPNRFALVPEDLEASQVYKRVTSENDNYRMPPPGSNKKALSEYEQALIKQWIQEGAAYKQHWAFIPPAKAALPSVENQDWARNAIDVYILARLEAKGLEPSSEADRETLIRRLHFDLTGLPPTPEEIDAFISASEPDAYEQLVDRLLANAHYGERLAMEWLDVARYADTHAIHVDMRRTSWPWRDWVIKAFNDNKPFDEFVVEQLAGDLLPDATLEQKLATSFNRHHGISNEGGAIDEELRIEYAADRVATVGTAFMGLTMNCARCHDHKYDPVSMDDYYSMMSFFNSVDQEKGLEVQNEYTAFAYRPYVEVWRPTERKEFDENEDLLKEIKAKSEWDEAFATTFKANESVKPLKWLALLAKGEAPPPSEGDKKDEKAPKKNKVWDIRVGNRQSVFERIRDPNSTRDFAFVLGLPARPDPVNLLRIEIPKLHTLDDLRMAYAFVPAYLRSLKIELGHKSKSPEGKDETHWSQKIVAWSWAPQWDDQRVEGYKQAVDNDPNTIWEVTPSNRPYSLFLLLDEAIPKSEATEQLRITLSFRKGGTHMPQTADVFAAACPEGPAQIQALAPFSPLALIPADQLSDWQKRSLVLDWRQAQGEADAGIHQSWWRARDRQFILQKTVVRTMVMKEMAEPRPTYVLKRGQYDQPDKERARGRAIPAVFGTLLEDASKDRLGLAQWLVQPDNPLVSRVTVNRYWQMLFGIGLVKSTEDFGAQGEVPSHAALLDYLALDFQESGWDVKRLIRRLVTSATYRQRSDSRADQQGVDPENRLLARYPRTRLQAEMIRDNALSASGLLVKTIGGPSVKPYQPAGLWRERAMRKDNATGTFLRDSGSKLYRRSMYTFWKQAAPPPQMATFDAPAREVCVVRRSRTNTPLQALVLQNDETYLEIARKLAERVMQENPGDWAPTLEKRLVRAFRRLTGRRPGAEEVQALAELSQANLDAFTGQPAQDPAKKTILQYGESKIDASLPPLELASLSFSMSAILNLDETITQD